MDESPEKTDSKGETATASQESSDGVADNQTASKRSKREKSKDKSNPPSPKRQKSVDKKEAKDTAKTGDSTNDENQNVKTKAKKEEPLKNGSGSAAAIPLISDPRLPAGWMRKVVQRQGGQSAGKFDVYIYSPEGKKFRSRFELARFFEKTSSSLKIEDFDFTVHGSGSKNAEKKPTKRKIEDKPKKTKSEPAPKKTKAKVKKATPSKQRLVVKLNFSPKKRALESLKQSNASEAVTSSKSSTRRTAATPKSKKPPAKEKVKSKYEHDDDNNNNKNDSIDCVQKSEGDTTNIVESKDSQSETN